MFNLVDEIFVPGRRHAEEERRRLEHTRFETGSNDPSRGPIDLASGHVLIRTSPQDTVHDDAPDGTAPGEGPGGSADGS